MFLRLILILLIVVVSGWNDVFAQEPTSNSLKLVVIDPHGDFIQGAKVILTKEEKAIANAVSSLQGEASFKRLEAGSYQLTVKAKGFVPYQKNINLKAGINNLKIALTVANISETVEVELSEREKKFERIIAKVFAQEEIERLPNTPKDIEKELRRRFGAGATIRIDGFEGGKFPDKSQIASIKVIKSVFDAEFHDVGDVVIEITTRAGGTDWSGDFSFSLADAALNARNAFVAKKLPFYNRSTSVVLVPPSIGKNTSLYFSFSHDDSKSSREFIGISPDEVVDNDLPTTSSSLYPTIRVTQNLSAHHTLLGEYSYYNLKEKGLGLGWFDLPERAYSNTNASHTLRVSENGIIGRFVNNFRFEYSELHQEINPVSDEPPIIVLEAFNAGGAGIKSTENHQTFKLSNILSFDQGSHAIKLGVELEHERSDLTEQLNQNGSFTFSSVEDFEAGLPYLFTQQIGEGRVNASNTKTSLFIQDNIRLSRYFQLGLGVRYEHQSGVKDYNNFAPRLGFTWSPERTGRLFITGGFGIMYDWMERDNLLHILKLNGESSSELVIINPSFPDPYQEGFKELSSVFQLDNNLRNPVTYTGYLAADYELNRYLKLRAVYLIGKETNSFRSRDINAPINGVRPDPTKGRIVNIEPTGNLLGHRLFLKADTTVKGIPIEFNYTLSRDTSDYEGIFELPSDSYNLRAEWGAESGQATHQISLFTFFTLSKLIPFNPLKNIDVNFNAVASSGLPYTIITGRDDNGDGVINDRPQGVKRNSERENWAFSTDASFNWNMPRLFNGAIDGMSLSVNINNLFNQTNKRGFVGVQTSPFFGQPTYSDPARNISLGLYINF